METEKVGTNSHHHRNFCRHCQSDFGSLARQKHILFIFIANSYETVSPHEVSIGLRQNNRTAPMLLTEECGIGIFLCQRHVRSGGRLG